MADVIPEAFLQEAAWFRRQHQELAAVGDAGAGPNTWPESHSRAVERPQWLLDAW